MSHREDPIGWNCSLGALGLCIDALGEPINASITTTLDSCPHCGLPKGNGRELNARNTHGLLHETNSLMPFLIPILDFVIPLANVVVQYLRIEKFEIGDCVDVPDSEGCVHGAVVLQTLSCKLSPVARERRRPWFSRSSLANDNALIHLALVRFLGWPSSWDEILEVDILRTYSYLPCNPPKPQFSSLLRSNPRSWFEDRRWVAPMVYVYWKRYEHGDFVAEVLAGQGFSHAARKEK